MKWKIILSPLTLLLLLALLAACEQEPLPVPATELASDNETPTEVAPTATNANTATPGATPTVTTTPTPATTPTPTRLPTGPVTVCLRDEPPSLYLYGPDSYAAQLIREVVYDGPIDTRGFTVQPVILEEIPSLENGGATLEAVPVREGEWVVDVEGNVVRLRPGITVYPAGCTSASCAVTYDPERVPEETPAAEGEVTVTPAPTATPAVALEMDRIVAEFTLLPDLTWSDGEPLTAADSVYSFELAQEAELPPRLRTGKQGVVPARTIDPVPRTASYSAVDERTVRWVGVPGFLDFHYQSNFFTPLPEHQLSMLSADSLLEAEESARLPLGWGPYVLREWVPGEQIVAERNPNYFREDEGLPYFDQVIFRFLAEQTDVDVGELANGGCDVVTRNLLSSDYEQYLAQEDAGRATLHAVPGTTWEHLDFGINPVPDYDWRGDVFQDPRVRQAAAYCVNREALAAEMMAGMSVVPNAYVPPVHPLYEAAELADYPYDPQRGKELLASAGWRDTNGDGVVEAYGIDRIQDGTLLAVNYTATGSAFRQRIAERVSADLATCGFRIFESEPVPAEQFFATDDASPIFSRRFDLANFAWFSDAQPPCHLFLSSQIPTILNGWSGLNVTGYENETYDAACTSGQAAVPGMDAYRENHLQALRIFNEELPVVPLFQHIQAALTRPDLEGFLLDPTESAETSNVEQWRLPVDD